MDSYVHKSLSFKSMHIIGQDIKSATIVKIQVASLRFATHNAECLVLRKVPPSPAPPPPPPPPPKQKKKQKNKKQVKRNSQKLSLNIRN